MGGATSRSQAHFSCFANVEALPTAVLMLKCFQLLTCVEILQVSLDIGPEPGTWMPPTWGRSGTRANLKCKLHFQQDGDLQLMESGPWDHLTVSWSTSGNDIIGRWVVHDEAVSFYMEHSGLRRNDIVLDAGRIYGTTTAWGPQLSRKGNLTLKKRKLGWLPFLPSLGESSFLIGCFRSRSLDEA